VTISAKIITDSIGTDSPRLTTLQLRYPKFIHGEFMTHRVFSRNASSSRAIPVERLIADVVDDPVYPSHWGANQRGMQADQECDAKVILPSGGEYLGRSKEAAWDKARENAIELAQAFTAAGYHKQIVNRLLEPFCHINIVVTATEWSNFFALRCHPGAQPEMRLLAEAIRKAMEDSRPLHREPGHWHLPYVGADEWGGLMTRHYSDFQMVKDLCVRLSVARCARVSYLTQDGKVPSIEEDLALYDRLLSAVPLHSSPAEHQATPDELNLEDYTGGQSAWLHPDHHGNLRGWVQYRKTLAGECQ
jgi:hypothetical protein